MFGPGTYYNRAFSQVVSYFWSCRSLISATYTDARDKKDLPILLTANHWQQYVAAINLLNFLFFLFKLSNITFKPVVI